MVRIHKDNFKKATQAWQFKESMDSTIIELFNLVYSYSSFEIITELGLDHMEWYVLSHDNYYYSVPHLYKIKSFIKDNNLTNKSAEDILTLYELYRED